MFVSLEGQQQGAPTASAAASEASTATDALEQTAETPMEGMPVVKCLFWLCSYLCHGTLQVNVWLMPDLQKHVRRLSLLYLQNQSDPHTSRKSFGTSMLLAAQHLHVLHVTDCTACAFNARHPTTKPAAGAPRHPERSRKQSVWLQVKSARGRSIRQLPLWA